MTFSRRSGRLGHRFAQGEPGEVRTREGTSIPDPQSPADPAGQVAGSGCRRRRGSSARQTVFSQLAHVARPVVGAQSADARPAAMPRTAWPELAAEPAEEVLDQERDVLAALAQRRQVDADHVEAVVEVLAEAALARPPRAGRGWWRRRRARRRASGCGPPTPLDLALLQGAQQLGLERRAAARRSRRGRACRRRPARTGPAVRSLAPVKAPFSWPNSSLSSSVSGMAAQLTATKGPARAARCGVDGAGDQLLAGAALAGDQHGASTRGASSAPAWKTCSLAG